MDVNFIIHELDRMFPSPKCELEYSSIYQLLVAVLLSAQCTDKRVNMVTKDLFRDYGTPEKMIHLSQEELEDKIRPCGFYHNKAKHILSMSRDILSKYNGVVPNDLNALQSLAGVGRKTANVVIAEGFKGDAIAVDTHVLRTSNRLGIVATKDPFKCEEGLMKAFDEGIWSRLHLQLVSFGRYICKSQNPSCEKCPFKEICAKWKM